MFKQVLISAICTSLLGLGACSSVPGNFNGLGSDPMTMMVVVKNPYAGPMTTKQYKTTVVLGEHCLHAIRSQTASVVEVMATNAMADALAGGVGEGLGYKADAAVQGAKLGTKVVPGVAALGAIVTGAQGAVNGVKIKSSVVAGTTGACTNALMHDSVMHGSMEGVHTFGVPIRANNSSNRLPSWVQRSQEATVPYNAPASQNYRPSHPDTDNSTTNEPQDMNAQPQ
jgi:hypothetical protein